MNRLPAADDRIPSTQPARLSAVFDPIAVAHRSALKLPFALVWGTAALAACRSDTTRNITWLADMNRAATSSRAAANAGGTGGSLIQANGRMCWNAAVAWVDQLIYGGFSIAYWSGTEYAPLPTSALDLYTFDGSQLRDRKDLVALYAVAVRPGDMAAAVPEPQTLALALLALGATVVARRRRPR